MLDLSFLSDQACSTMIAFLALILSQIPPLRVVFKGIKIKATTTDQISLSHFLGNINLTFFLSIYNTGGRSVSISKIDCVIKSVNNSLCLHLPAQRYYSRQPPSQPNQQILEYFIGIIPLKPEETWSETVHCFSLWTQKEEEQVNNLISKIRSDIWEKKKKFPDPNVWVEANENDVIEARDFFENKFNLKKGNYYLLVAIISESDKVLTTCGYNFSLYDNNIHNLRACTGKYKYGEGIYFPSSDPLAVIYPKLTPMPSELAMREYNKFRSTLDFNCEID